MIWLVFALGLLLGFLVGVVFGDALALYRSSRKVRPMKTPALHSRRALMIALIATVVLNATVGVLLILTRESTADYTRCTATWQQQFGEAYQTRLDASVAVSGAMDDVVKAVASKDADAFRGAVERYVQIREQQDRERSRNPFPPLPETLCGSPEEVRR